jgi:AraC family transcriptional regulator
VKDFSNLPADFNRLTIPPQRCAVFTHTDHISSIRRAWFSIWNKGLPEAGLEATGGPEFERYDERFDDRSFVRPLLKT